MQAPELASFRHLSSVSIIVNPVAPSDMSSTSATASFDNFNSVPPISGGIPTKSQDLAASIVFTVAFTMFLTLILSQSGFAHYAIALD